MSDKRNKHGKNGQEKTYLHRPLPEWLTVKLDIPPDILEGGMRIEIRGRNSLLLHGCRKIIHYTPEVMKLQMKSCCVCITGVRLICHTYLAGAIGIEGEIIGLSFEDEEAE